MWANESVFYQIYPIGFCGAPRENDGVLTNRIKKIGEWAEYIKNLGATAVYLSPIFSSDSHGYDTRDYRKIDCRLGTNEDFKNVCDTLHKNNIRVVIDGVFNHVGRGFFAFEDVRQNRENSVYRDWFHIDFGGESCYGDGFWYKGWEGHYELAELNLGCSAVADYLLESVRMWINDFDIDGIRLDVAYLLNTEFMRRLRELCDSVKQDFFLVGEIIHGDYNRLLNEARLDSCTNYECYKGLYSSFNSMNMFEIAHSLNRQFGSEPWCLYTGRHLLSFVDNHDVTRIATQLSNKNHLIPVYAILFGMPGIPCIYYGSEWGEEGSKSDGDNVLRPAMEMPRENELSRYIAKLADIKKSSAALNYGSYKNIMITNKQLAFERRTEGECYLIGINADCEGCLTHFDGYGKATDMLTGVEFNLGGDVMLEAYSTYFWRLD